MDITMCKGANCPMKNWCYRYTAPKSDYQSYFMEVPHIHSNPIDCDYFWINDAYVKPVCNLCQGLTACSCEDTNPALP